MRYFISRTSQWSSDNKPPCEEAFRAAYVRLDARTTNDPAKIPAHKGKSTDWWYNEGRNHRVESGQIVREFDAEDWFIEVNTLEELMALYKKYGDLVIGANWRDSLEGYPRIEIYDDYRE